MKFVFLGLGVVAILATGISLLYRKKWWIRVFDFPRTQIIVLQLVCIVGLFFTFPLNQWYAILLMVLLVAATLVQFLYVYPYLPFAPKVVPDAPSGTDKTVSFMVSNVLMTNRKSEKLVEQVRAYYPDIFLALETDIWWEKALSEIEDLYPVTVKQPMDNTYGMLLYSRLPMRNTEIKHIIKSDIPSIHTAVELGDFVFQLRCLHPEPPAPGEAETSKPRDRELVRTAEVIRKSAIPHVVLGDLNDVAWSDTSYKFERISKLKDPRKGRGFFNTFHAKIPLFRFALDHIFVSPEFKLLEIQRLKGVYSDHFPMYFRFGVELNHRRE